MRQIHLFFYIGLVFADTVIEETILHRVGLGKIKVKDSRFNYDGPWTITDHIKSSKV